MEKTRWKESSASGRTSVLCCMNEKRLLRNQRLVVASPTTLLMSISAPPSRPSQPTQTNMCSCLPSPWRRWWLKFKPHVGIKASPYRWRVTDPGERGRGRGGRAQGNGSFHFVLTWRRRAEGALSPHRGRVGTSSGGGPASWTHRWWRPQPGRGRSGCSWGRGLGTVPS